jgi:hypothetical protein
MCRRFRHCHVLCCFHTFEGTSGGTRSETAAPRVVTSVFNMGVLTVAISLFVKNVHRIIVLVQYHFMHVTQLPTKVALLHGLLKFTRKVYTFQSHTRV